MLFYPRNTFLFSPRFFSTCYCYVVYITRNIKCLVWFSKMFSKLIFSWIHDFMMKFSHILFLENNWNYSKDLICISDRCFHIILLKGFNIINIILFSQLSEETNQPFLFCRWSDLEFLQLLSDRLETEPRPMSPGLLLFPLHNFASSLLSPAMESAFNQVVKSWNETPSRLYHCNYFYEMTFYYYFSLRKFSNWVTQSLKKWSTAHFSLWATGSIHSLLLLQLFVCQ